MNATSAVRCRRAGFNPPLLILALALTGCLQPQQRAEEFSAASWPARREALQSLDHWSLQSRIALSTDEEGWSGTLTWRQDENYVDARFSGPLGVGGFRIEGVPERLELETSEGEHFVFTDPEAELAAELGWRVPLASMRYWMLGVADPQSGDAEETLDEHGRLEELEQRDWTVRYTSYRSFDGDTLPRKLVMENDDLRIRLAVDDWELGGPRL
ncbi:MAG: outer membrane lipoprotein LolB [Gammaproteobacteria bacterium]|nr:outer membrane lipoprotein LolB [Gammaproteobacteria bacterium]